MITINYAKLIGEERRGLDRTGKLADFAVLTDDFLTVKPETLPRRRRFRPGSAAARSIAIRR